MHINYTYAKKTAYVIFVKRAALLSYHGAIIYTHHRGKADANFTVQRRLKLTLRRIKRRRVV